jgi:hypothetical protein
LLVPRWLDVQPSEFSFDVGDEPANLSFDLSHDYLTVEQSFVLGCSIKCEASSGKAPGFQFVDSRGIVDEAEAFPVGG